MTSPARNIDGAGLQPILSWPEPWAFRVSGRRNDEPTPRLLEVGSVTGWILALVALWAGSGTTDNGWHPGLAGGLALVSFALGAWAMRRRLMPTIIHLYPRVLVVERDNACRSVPLAETVRASIRYEWVLRRRRHHILTLQQRNHDIQIGIADDVPLGRLAALLTAEGIEMD